MWQNRVTPTLIFSNNSINIYFSILPDSVCSELAGLYGTAQLYKSKVALPPLYTLYINVYSVQKLLVLRLCCRCTGKVTDLLVGHHFATQLKGTLLWNVGKEGNNVVGRTGWEGMRVPPHDLFCPLFTSI